MLHCLAADFSDSANFFFLKKYMGKLSGVSQKDNQWRRIPVSSMFIGMM